jgi:hypothetical protein
VHLRRRPDVPKRALAHPEAPLVYRRRRLTSTSPPMTLTARQRSPERQSARARWQRDGSSAGDETLDQPERLHGGRHPADVEMPTAEPALTGAA